MIDFTKRRRELVVHLRQRGIGDERVLTAMSRIPRESFVPEDLHEKAYADNALPVAAGQTISQPFIVALMTQLLGLSGDETVLEIGTGTGYQTAVLARLARRVVTIERINELAEDAKVKLRQLGLNNVEFHMADGTLGWPDSAPYDAIVVTAGAPDVPAPLYNQLRLGGHLVIPIGSQQEQSLTLIVKRTTGPEITDAGGCRFVKLIGDAGWETAGLEWE